MEEWKTLNPPLSRYEISTLGNVKSKTKLMKHLITAKGYAKITMTNDFGNKTQKFVHRLVASTFCANPLGKPFVNHINGVKDDNRVENLEWVTCRENILHKYYVLGHETPSSCGGRKPMFPQSEIDKAYSLRAQGMSLREISGVTGISACHLSKILRGQYQNARREF